jgi:hypothetical protein
MLGVILRIVLAIVLVRFVIRLVAWMARAQDPPRLRPERGGPPPRIVDVDFTEERPEKDRR